MARELLEGSRSCWCSNWRQKATARSQVKLAIEDALDQGLPRAYTPDLYQQKCSAVFEHVYETYGDRGVESLSIALFQGLRAVILHCAQKLVTRIPFIADLPDPSVERDGQSGPLSSRHAHLLTLDRRQCVLFCHDATRYALFVPGLRAPQRAELGRWHRELRLAVLEAQGLPQPSHCPRWSHAWAAVGSLSDRPLGAWVAASCGARSQNRCP